MRVIRSVMISRNWSQKNTVTLKEEPMVFIFRTPVPMEFFAAEESFREDGDSGLETV